MKRLTSACFVSALVLALGSGDALAQATKKSSKKKRTQKTSKVSKTKKANKSSLKVKNQKKSKNMDNQIVLALGYQRDSFRNLNINNNLGGNDKVQTKGIAVGVGLSMPLTPYLAAEIRPTFTRGEQSRSTGSFSGDNSLVLTTATVNSKLLYSVTEGEIALRPYVEGAIGYGLLEHDVRLTNTNSSYESSLDVDGIVYELNLGVELKFRNGITPFAQVGIRRFNVEDSTSSETTLGNSSALPREDIVDSANDYSAATARVGLSVAF